MTININAAVNIVTRGFLSGNADVLAVAGRIIRSEFVWREIIYLTFTSDAINTEINLTSSVQKELELTSAIQTEIALTSSVTKEQNITSSVQKTIEIDATIISRYYA